MLDLPKAPELLDLLVVRLQAYLAARQISAPLLIGIHSGGAWLAERLGSALGLQEAPGLLDISFYRDDYSQSGLHTGARPSRLPSAIDGRHVILVDDILYSGRTIRAALNELFDYGRPASVSLAVLISRDGRELPIQADCCALELSLPRTQVIKLRGPEPLHLELVERHA